MPKKLAQLAEATDPKYLSMVKTPANRSGFKIIRSDEDQKPPKSDNNSFTPTRKRRKDSEDGMLYISLPTDFTEEQANAVMDRFGLEEDYELYMDDTVVRLVRSDYMKEEKALPDTVAIRLDKEKDIVAHVAEASFKHTKALRSDNKIAGAVLESIEFEGMSDHDVDKYLKSVNIEVAKENIERIDDETFVAVLRLDNVQRTDRVKLADGIHAKVYRAEANDIPESIARGVVESCYGNYGYGQLDFFAALTDELYTEAAYDAVRTLGDILRDITIRSGLNLSSRVDLMNNALSQYSFYMTELMNSLPRSVVSVMTSDISKTSDKEDNTMAGKIEEKDIATKEGEDTKRSDEVVVDEVVADEADKDTDGVVEAEAARSDEESEKAVDEDKQEDPKEEMLKRSDVQAMIDAAVAAAISVERKDDKVDTKEEIAEVKTDDGEGDDAAKRDDSAISKLVDTVDALATKVEEMGNTSTVRYDNGSAAGTDNDGGVFRGSIFGKK